MKLAVIGSINMDQVVTTARIPAKGETLHGTALEYIPGGKGANQAVAMARLGAQVTMFGCVGDDDNGKKLIANLQKEQVDTSRIQTVNGTPSGLAVITVAENDNVIIVIPGANAKVDRAYIDSIASELSTFDLIVLQHEIPQDSVHYIIDYCAAHNIPVVLNPAPAEKVPKEIVDKVKYLTPNEHEAAIIFGENTTAEECLTQYPEKLIITQGAKGVSFCTKEGEVVTVPAYKAKVVDTTGAGDTLNGAFCVRIAAGDNILDALRYANAAAGLSVEAFGAQGGMPTDEAVRKKMETA